MGSGALGLSPLASLPQAADAMDGPGKAAGRPLEMFFWNSLAFSLIQRMLAIWSLVPLPFLKPA